MAEIERRLSLIDQLEKTVEADLACANRLRQSIHKLAFAGQLVPQDSNDEPVSVLLKRIQAAEIVEDLCTALEQFEEILANLGEDKLVAEIV